MEKLLAALLFLLPCEAFACGAFRLKAADGTVISARTMEFGYDVKYALAASPRGRNFASPGPADKPAMKWKSRYGYAGVSVFGNDDMIVDGMNEAGLAASGLWYDAGAKWPEIKPGAEDKALAHTMLISWLLGSFANVAEAKAALANTTVFGLYVPQMKAVPPLHFAVYDGSGAAIVIEAANGETRVYDNPIGVMTNAPDFPWMVSNLRNYTGLSPALAPAADYSGVKLLPTGHGSGMSGLPGDITPPSRFVKLAAMLHFADTPADAKAALNLAEHVSNGVDIVSGMAVDRDEKGAIVSSETTQWAAFRDLTNRILYLRTYDSMTLRKVDLGKLDFSGGVKRTALYGDAEAVIDITNRFSAPEIAK
ncbi:MAG: choloylglycine hydrolase family protein [Elusimicrobiales bacterium]